MVSHHGERLVDIAALVQLLASYHGGIARLALLSCVLARAQVHVVAVALLKHGGQGGREVLCRCLSPQWQASVTGYCRSQSSDMDRRRFSGMECVQSLRGKVLKSCTG